MLRSIFGLFALLLMFSVAVNFQASRADGAEQPNIVFIISDDHDNEHLGFMGNDAVHTPNLDRLAKAGAVFTTAHLPMSRCHPTLASFLSGRWPHQSGIYYNYGTAKLSPTNSLPSLLRDGGYATYVEGKYWEGDRREMGFTHGPGKTSRTFVRQGQSDLFAFIDEVGGQQFVDLRRVVGCRVDSRCQCRISARTRSFGILCVPGSAGGRSQHDWRL